MLEYMGGEVFFRNTNRLPCEVDYEDTVTHKVYTFFTTYKAYFDMPMKAELTDILKRDGVYQMRHKE